MSDIEQVRQFWNTHINNEYYTKNERASEEYFAEITRKRYQHHYHLPELFAAMGPGAGRKLLEIGCGIGIDTVSLSEKGFDVTAIDLTESAIAISQERARKLNLSINYLVGNVERLDFPDNTFDVVYSFGVIHHTPHMRQAIREIFRVLRPGGTAYIMIYARYSLVNAIHVLFRIPYESPKDLNDHAPVVIRSSKKEVYEFLQDFKAVSVHADYPFTYGMRIIGGWVPVGIKKLLGRLLGWHLMITASK